MAVVYYCCILLLFIMWLYMNVVYSVLFPLRALCIGRTAASAVYHCTIILALPLLYSSITIIILSWYILSWISLSLPMLPLLYSSILRTTIILALPLSYVRSIVIVLCIMCYVITLSSISNVEASTPRRRRASATAAMRARVML